MRRSNPQQKQQSTTKQQKTNEQQQQQQQNLEEIRTETRKQQDQLHLKQLEYNLIEDMDMKEINKLLLEKNAAVFQQIHDLFDRRQIEIPEQKINLNDIKNRSPRSYAKNYIRQSKDIYKKLNQSEIKELVDKCNQNTRIQNQKQIENARLQQLNQEYYQKYWTFLQNQPQVEKDRRILIQELGEVHELLSVLNNAPSFDQPKIWNKEQVPEDDQKLIDEICIKNIKKIENKYDYSIYDLENNDILNEVKKYLGENYFNYEKRKEN